jgi:AcrR family transcriptional regulator
MYVDDVNTKELRWVVRRIEPSGQRPASPRQPRRPRRPKRYHHGDLPRALLDSALRIVEAQGTDALTLRAVARLAGVSQAAPYRHFANKEAILAAVAEEGFRSLLAAIRQSVQACDDVPLARLRAVGIGYVTFATSHPSHFRVMFGRDLADRSAFPALRQVADDTLAMVVGAIADCQRAGLVRPEEPAADLALIAWSSVHGLSALLIEGVLDRPVADVAEMVTRDLFLGLGVRQG